MTTLSVKSVILGDPASPRHQINPFELKTLLEQIQSLAALDSNLYFEDTLANLNAVSAPTDGSIGFVLNDTTNTGTYRRELGTWTITAALPAGFSGLLPDDATGFAILRQSYLAGDTPQNFTQTLDGSSGEADEFVGDVVATFSDGAFVRLSGAKVLGVLERMRLLEDTKVVVSWSVRRSLNPTDPAGDTVRLGISWLDGLKQIVLDQTVVDVTLTQAMGVYDASRVLGEDITPPASAVYFVPYVRTFGLDGQTDVRVLGSENEVQLAKESRTALLADLATRALDADNADLATRATDADNADLATRATDADSADYVEAEDVNVPILFQWPQSAIPEFPIANTIYVAENGSDLNSGTSSSKPLATINAAIDKMEAQGSPCVMIVHPGSYVVQPDTVIPANCALYGYDLRVTTLTLPAGQEVNNMFLMTSGIKVRGFTFRGLQHDSITFDPATETYSVPTKGWVFSFNAGEVITRSPYIADCSQLHSLTQEQLVLPIDRANGNPDMPLGGGNLLADGSVLDLDSPLRSVVVDSFTAINPNGVGYAITRNAFVQLVSVFTNWSRVGLWCNEGGQVTVANSNNTFGDYALAATGFRRSVQLDGVPNQELITEQDASAAIIDSQFEAIVTDLMVRYSGLSGWSGTYDELAERDTRTILRAIANDLRSGQDRATQYVIKGFFNWNAELAFNPSLVGIFTASWDEIIAELVQRFTDAAAEQMVGELVGFMKLVINDVNTNGSASQYVSSFASVVEATGQQFSYAGSGVNYNSLPFSQRGTGEAPESSLAIIESLGGRVYATYSTEVGDTYLGKDLRVDFERSTIEGQAFSRGVQNISLPLTIALGG